MKHALTLGLLAIATPALATTNLPVGAVACLSLKDAKNFASYTAKAPDFAKDLLARAACYEVKEPVEAVALGRAEQGFQAYKLLSGHKVWLPAAR